jgi:hypothetical protein
VEGNGEEAQNKSNIYEERLRELNLQTLSERRQQVDMAIVHEILHGRGGLDYSTWFKRAVNGTRATRSTADPYNLKVRHGRLDQSRTFLQNPRYRGLEPYTVPS